MLQHRQLAVLLCLSLALFSLACGDNDDETAPTAAPETATPGTVTGTAGGPEPDLDAPASQFTLELDDMAPGYLRNPAGTYLLDAASYGGSSAFDDDEDGEALLNDWGYVDGYETEFQPEGQETGVLQGKNYIAVESHLFSGAAGAHSFYEHLTALLESGNAREVRSQDLANESSAWRMERGVVPQSSIPAGYSWFVFRRGNLVSVVKVYGASDFVDAAVARRLAVLVDERALGDRDPVEPAPTPTAAR